MTMKISSKNKTLSLIAAVAVLSGSAVVSGGFEALPECNNAARPDAVTVGMSRYFPVSMKRVAEAVTSDPTGIWGNRIRNFNNPNGTDIWIGTERYCDGSVMTISQFVNRQCSNENTCPIRVMLQKPGANKVDLLVNYQQACTDHETFLVRTDGRGIMTCYEQWFWARGQKD